MTHRFVLLVCLWVLVVLPAAWLGWCAWHGFDPSLCWAHGGCQELRA